MTAPFALKPTLTPEDQRLSDAIDALIKIGGVVGKSIAERRGADFLVMRDLLRAYSNLHNARASAEQTR